MRAAFAKAIVELGRERSTHSLADRRFGFYGARAIMPVRIIATGGGLEHGTAGATHYGLEDVRVMRIQPGIQ